MTAPRTTEWWDRQGRGIANKRGRRVALACEWIVKSTKVNTLNEEQIALAESRALSQARMSRFGPGALKEGRAEQWHAQMAAVRACVKAGEDVATLPDVGWIDKEGRARAKAVEGALA